MRSILVTSSYNSISGYRYQNLIILGFSPSGLSHSLSSYLSLQCSTVINIGPTISNNVSHLRPLKNFLKFLLTEQSEMICMPVDLFK